MSSELQFVSQPGFKCCAEWHLRDCGALPLAIYRKIGAMTLDKNPDTGVITYRNYYAGIDSMADFFYNGATTKGEYQATWKAFQKLVVIEFIKQLPTTQRIAALENGEERPGVKWDLKTTQFRRKDYLFVPHAEWAEAHPGQCYVDPAASPWHGDEHDELAALLFSLSDGKAKWPEGAMARLRKSGLSDEAIEGRYREHIAGLKERPRTPRDWQNARGGFLSVIHPTG